MLRFAATFLRNDVAGWNLHLIRTRSPIDATAESYAHERSPLRTSVLPKKLREEQRGIAERNAAGENTRGEQAGENSRDRQRAGEGAREIAVLREQSLR